jgi:hypothetical protein
MKKILLVLIVLFLSVSSSFAYRQTCTITTDPSSSYFITGPTTGQDNFVYSNCSYAKVTANWYSATPEAFGHVSSGDYSGANIADYTWSSDGSSSYYYSSGYYTPRYWGIIYFYLEAYGCYGTATLEWDTI